MGTVLYRDAREFFNAARAAAREVRSIRRQIERMEMAAEGLLDEDCSLGDTKICVDIIDQFIEADKNNFVTKVMIKINRD